MTILIKIIILESTFWTCPRPAGFDSKKELIAKKGFWLQKKDFDSKKGFWRARASRPEAGPPGPDRTLFLEPNPYKTCRFLRFLAKMRSQKGPDEV